MDHQDNKERTAQIEPTAAPAESPAEAPKTPEKAEGQAKMKALFVSINAGFAEDLVALLREVGARGASILNTRGEGTRHQSFMGITVDSEKELILCVMEEEIAKKAMKRIKEKMGMDTPAHSVCFTMPIGTVVGLNAPMPEKAVEAAEK